MVCKYQHGGQKETLWALRLKSMEQIISILFFIFLGCVLYIAIRKDRKSKYRHETEALQKLRSLIDLYGLNESQITYYRDSSGIWIETSKDDFIDLLKGTCRTFTRYGYRYHEGIFILGFDPEVKGILCVTSVYQYDFSKNVYYKEWAQGNSEFNNKVEKAMGRK